MPKISVIVPVYNVENYLEKCIDSICAQSLRDIEIICVDDGSVDNSGEILDKAASKDRRVKVIHKKNAGYGAAMNVGLDLATGEYIGIVESDDYIRPEMFETLYKAAVENDLDMVKSDAYYWIEKEDFLSRIHTKGVDTYYDRVLDELDRNYFFEFYMNIWTGIYKTTFLHDHFIRFHESPGASYQDNGFWLLTCIYAKRAMWLNKAFYYYRQDNPMASVRNHGKIMAMTKEYEYVENFLKERGHEKYLPYCYTWKLIRNVGNYNRIIDETKIEFCEQIEKDYLSYSPYIQKLSYLNNFFTALIKEPVKTTKKIVEVKANIVDRLQTANAIVIYGAGKYGERTFRILYNEGLVDKMPYFAVTNAPSNKKVGNRKVITIEKAVEENQNALFIVAVVKGSSAWQAMIQKLEELHVTNYIDGSDLTENFYIA